MWKAQHRNSSRSTAKKEVPSIAMTYELNFMLLEVSVESVILWKACYKCWEYCVHEAMLLKWWLIVNVKRCFLNGDLWMMNMRTCEKHALCARNIMNAKRCFLNDELLIVLCENLWEFMKYKCDYVKVCWNVAMLRLGLLELSMT